MNIDDKLFTLGNGKQYMVLESLDYEGTKYAYLSNKDNELEALLVKVIIDNGIKFEKIEPNFLNNKILPLFLEKFQRYE